MRVWSLLGVVALTLAGVAMVGAVAAPALETDTVKLSGPLPEFGDVSEQVVVSPDGSRVVYLADAVYDDVPEAFVVPVAGGEPVRVHTPLGPEPIDGFGPFVWTRDGERVVYEIDDGGSALFVSDLDGSEPLRLTPPLEAGWSIADFMISPDGNWVVYTIGKYDEIVPHYPIDLMAVSTVGGVPVVIHSAGPEVHSARGASISPDSSTVVYGVVEAWPEEWYDPLDRRLYSQPIGGGPIADLCGALEPTDGCGYEQITSDSEWVVFRTSNYYNDYYQEFADFYSVPLHGGDPVPLNDPLQGGEAIWGAPILTNDGTHAVYLVDRQQSEFGPFDLYIAPVGGGTPRQLDPPDFDGIGSPQLSPDSTFVVIRGAWELEDTAEVFVVELATGAMRRISDGADHDLYDMAISADSKWVAYSARAFADLRMRLYSAPIVGGATRTLATTTVPGYSARVDEMTVTPDSVGVLVVSELMEEGTRAVSHVPIGGGPHAELAIDPAAVVTEPLYGTWQFGQGPVLLLVADLDTPDQFELYALALPRYECGGVAAAIVGTDGDDMLEGTWGPDVIAAGSGDDTIAALDGPDRVCGDAGNDRILGGAGRDLLWGGAGDDEILAGPGDDTVWAGPGADTVFGMGGRDLVSGAGGDDVIDGGEHDDLLYGGPGADVIYGARGSDILFGQAGRDVLVGGQHDDQLYGGTHADLLRGGPQDDSLHGGAHADELRGGGGVDACDGDAGRDVGVACEAVIGIP